MMEPRPGTEPRRRAEAEVIDTIKREQHGSSPTAEEVAGWVRRFPGHALAIIHHAIDANRDEAYSDGSENR